MTPTPSRRVTVEKRNGLVGLVVAGSLLFSCIPTSDPGMSDGIAARNETSEELHFRIFAEGEWFDLTAVAEPGESLLVLDRGHLSQDSLLTENDCTIGDLIALASDGREVARHEPPLCVDDVWVITEEGE